MNNVLRLVLAFGLVSSAWAQIDTPLIPPEQDQRDLFARAAASRVALIGTVIKSEGVVPRAVSETLQERQNKGKDLRASLYTVKVEEIVCRQSDFDDKVPRIDARPQPFYLFIPFDESVLPDGHFREALLPNGRYLLLLTELDGRQLTDAYELDPNRVYYRGEDHNRGVIPLGDSTPASRAKKPPEVVDKFKRLCAAMRPSKPADKLALLQLLADSGDPVLQKETEIAMTAVKAGLQNAEAGAQPAKNEPH